MPVKTIARAFGVPITVEKFYWLPVIQLIVGWLLTRWAGRRPGRTTGQKLAVGALSTAALLGSEWAHNLAHAAAAQSVGKPMDELRVIAGMPRVIYRNTADPTVTPRQHIARALGGPRFNLSFLLFWLLLRAFTRPGTAARDIADVGAATNAFIGGVAFWPHPMIDGGPILKWSLVEAGKTPAEADRVVQKTNLGLGAGLAVAAGAAALNRRPWLAALLGLFSLSSLAAGLGRVREDSFRPQLEHQR